MNPGSRRRFHKLLKVLYVGDYEGKAEGSKIVMVLNDYWFDRPDVEKFMEVLEKMGFDWEITDLEAKPTMRIWRSTSKKDGYKKTIKNLQK